MLIGVTIWVAAFFRDPVRVTPQAEGQIISPADGLVTMIERVPVPREIAGPEGLNEETRVRVSIFMSVFDCHVNRSPVPGRIERIVYKPGVFLNADLDKASEDNERNSLVISTPAGRIGVIQIAGLVAPILFGGRGKVSDLMGDFGKGINSFKKGLAEKEDPKVINAEGEFQASERLRDAARVMQEEPISIQLRYLQTLLEIGSTNSSTIVFPAPIDMLRPLIERALPQPPPAKD